MKAEELMIGDWIKRKDDNKSRKVDTIISIDDACLLHTSKEELSFDYMFEPILITVEMLEKNGAEAYDSFATIDLGQYHVIYDYDGFLTIVDNVDNVKKISYINCDYVHQLQHALRLCGINKEIVL